MRDLLQVAAAMAIGAAAMYVLDPQQGRRRRALARDKVVSISNNAAEAALSQGRRVAGTVQGAFKAGRARVTRSSEPVDEFRLHERVRACIGRVTRHPKSIRVDVTGADVRLTGDVLAKEVDALVDAVNRVAGVDRVENGLTLHESAAGVPALQGVDEEADGRWNVPLWTVVAVAAPLAIFAVTERTELRRFIEPRRRVLPRAVTSKARRLKSYLNELRVS